MSTYILVHFLNDSKTRLINATELYGKANAFLLGKRIKKIIALLIFDIKRFSSSRNFLDIN